MKLILSNASLFQINGQFTTCPAHLQEEEEAGSEEPVYKGELRLGLMYSPPDKGSGSSRPAKRYKIYIPKQSLYTLTLVS